MNPAEMTSKQMPGGERFGEDSAGRRTTKKKKKKERIQHSTSVWSLDKQTILQPSVDGKFLYLTVFVNFSFDLNFNCSGVQELDI